ncbi:MAG: LytTR family transcriptional regulator DNA-binding domain-containing protein [Lachnospiraceae bacterium]|nr:LytTR family transcriptional regulator DNA-binding domain-containing protein [Lachnospiraceae bacterium]
MKIDIEKISEGEESVVIRYKTLTPELNKIIGILESGDSRIWGKTETESLCVDAEEILFVESVDDKVFAYTWDKILRIEGTLNSFLIEVNDESFFRCSKSMVINVNRVKALKSLSSNRIDATMEGGEHIIISRRYASDFRRLLKGER